MLWTSKGSGRKTQTQVYMEQSISMKVLYNIDKKVLNISLTAKVLGWNKLSTEMNILPVLIATGRVHYSPQVGYHNNKQIVC